MTQHKTSFKLLTLLLALSLTGVFSLGLCMVAKAEGTPTVSDIVKEEAVNTDVHFSAQDFESGFSAEEEPMTAIRIVTLPDESEAVLALGDTTVITNQEIAAADIDTLVLTPVTDWTGTTVFQYQAKADADYSEAATVTVTISEALASPLTVEDITLAVTENTAKTGTLVGHSSDDDITSFEYSIEETPTKGSIEITDVNSGEFVYTPNADTVGTDSFTYKTAYHPYESNLGTVSITISESPEGETPPELFQYADMQTHWASFTAAKLVEENMIIGYKSGNKYYFEPEKKFTRGDFVLMLTTAMGEQYLPAANTANFLFADDASIPYWIKDLAYSAAAAHVISGVGASGNVYLHANEPLTRIEAIIMINNAMSPATNSTSTLDFADLNSVPSWGMEALRNLEGYGLVTGYDDNTFRPYGHVTKAEAAQMVYQFVKYVEEYPETRLKWMGIAPASTTPIQLYNVETGYMAI